MSEETPCLRPQPGTDGSHPALLRAPEVHTHAPAGRDERGLLQPHVSRTIVIQVRLCLTFGEGSFSTIVRRDRGGGLPTGESGMKEDQYPYRVLFSAPLTTDSRQCSAP